jgi:hypothetical protein
MNCVLILVAFDFAGAAFQANADERFVFIGRLI